jgi:hypothetical protein
MEYAAAVLLDSKPLSIRIPLCWQMLLHLVIKPEFPTSYGVVFYCVQRVKKRMIVRFADIGGIVDHQCASFRFITLDYVISVVHWNMSVAYLLKMLKIVR